MNSVARSNGRQLRPSCGRASHRRLGSERLPPKRWTPLPSEDLRWCLHKSFGYSMLRRLKLGAVGGEILNVRWNRVCWRNWETKSWYCTMGRGDDGETEVRMLPQRKAIWVLSSTLLVPAILCVSNARAESEVQENHGVLRVPHGYVPAARRSTGEGGAPEVGDTTTSCQENPDNDAIEGIICTFADLTAVGLGDDPVPLSLSIADNFEVESNGQLTGVTWWGFMVERAGPGAVNDCTLNIAPSENDLWSIRYYTDDGFGFPDPEGIIAEFEVAGTDPGFTRIDTGEDPFGLVSKMEIHYDFPEPLPILCGVNYHAEIYSNYTFNDCYYCWQPAPPGDARSLQTDFDPDTEDLPNYDVKDENIYDMSLCQDFEPAGAEANLPRVALSLVRPPDVETGCCEIRYTVENGNCVGLGAIQTFFVAFAKGNASNECEDLMSISAPNGWNVAFCEEWSSQGRSVYRFSGGSLGELQSTSGMIRTRVNGPTDIILDANNAVPAFGIRAWASDDILAGNACGTGQFGPLVGENGEWGEGRNVLCPFAPIPSMSTPGKGLLVLLVAGGGLFLVIRSRTTPAAQTI